MSTSGFVDQLAGQRGFPTNTGLGPAYGAAKPPEHHVTVLTDGIIGKMEQWFSMFQEQGAQRSVRSLLRDYMAEEVGVMGPKVRKTATLSTPATVNRDHFSSTVLVPLLVTQLGMFLSSRQEGTLQALLSLLSVAHTPRERPSARPKFLMRFKRIHQNTAQRGKIDSQVAGAGQEQFDVVVELDTYVAGFNIGEQDMFYNSDPNKVIELIDTKMEQLRTTWLLTIVGLHADYASRQPTLTQTLESRLHAPNGPGHLMATLALEHGVFGCFNRSHHNAHTLLLACAEAVQSKENNFVVVVPHAVVERGIIDSSRELVTVPRRSYTYVTNSPVGFHPHTEYGHVNGGPLDLFAVTDTHVDVRAAGPPVPSANKGAVAQGDAGTTVDVATLSNNQKCYIIGIGHEAQCDAALKHEGVKRSFFTVGGVPDIYHTHANVGFFGSAPAQKCSVTPRSVTEENPSFTYFMNHDTGAVVKTCVQDINRRMAMRELFEPESAFRTWIAAYSEDALGYWSPTAAADPLLRSNKEREANPAGIFESNPRFMFMRIPPNTQDVPKVVTSTYTVGYLPRQVLGNASSYSSFENEMVVCVGSLSHIHRDSVSHLSALLDLMGAHLQRLDSVEHVGNIITLRSSVGFPVGTVLYLLTHCKSKTGGYLSDPALQVLFLRWATAVADPAFNTDANNRIADPEIGALMQFRDEQLPWLLEMIGMFTNAYAEIQQLVRSTYTTVEYNALLGAQEPLVDAGANNPYPLQMRWLYGFACPALTKHLLVPSQDPETTMRVADIPGTALQNEMLTHRRGVFVLTKVRGDANYSRRNAYMNSVNSIGIFSTYFTFRYRRLRREYGSSGIVCAFALMHYWTMYNRETLEHHLDRQYPSGIAYLVVRTLKYRGHDMAVMPVQSVRLLVGDSAAAYPHATWHSTEYRQSMELGAAPMSLGAMGTVVHDVYIDNLRGMGEEWRVHDDNTMIVLDSYNTYLPEGSVGYQPHHGVLSMYGKFDSGPAVQRDAVTGVANPLPTSDCRASHIFRVQMNQLSDPNDDHNMVLFAKGFQGSGFLAGLPTYLAPTVAGENDSEAMLKTASKANYAHQRLNTAEFGCLTTGDYTVGLTSSSWLRVSAEYDPNRSITQPRIHAQGGLNANGIFSQRDSDPAFMNRLLHATSASRLASNRDF